MDNNNSGDNSANNMGMPAQGLFPTIWLSEEELGRATTTCLVRVFVRMFAALLVTAVSAYAVASSLSMQAVIFENMYIYFGLIILELVLVFSVSARINKLSPTAANVLFYFYALVNGLTLSVVFLAYDIGVIYRAFAVTALTFAAMALYGTTTRRDCPEGSGRRSAASPASPDAAAGLPISIANIIIEWSEANV